MVLIEDAKLEVTPELVAQRLLDVMRQPFELEGVTMPLVVNTSVGIAIGDRPTGGELLRDADVALYHAKRAGKNRYEVYFPELQTEITRHMEFEFELRSALVNDQFRLAYQPIYNQTSSPTSSSPFSNRPVRSTKSAVGCSAEPASRRPNGTRKTSPSGGPQRYAFITARSARTNVFTT